MKNNNLLKLLLTQCKPKGTITFCVAMIEMMIAKSKRYVNNNYNNSCNDGNNFCSISFQDLGIGLEAVTWH